MLPLVQPHAVVLVVIQAVKLVVKQQPPENVLPVRTLTTSLQASAQLVQIPTVILALVQEVAHVHLAPLIIT